MQLPPLSVPEAHDMSSQENMHLPRLGDNVKPCHNVNISQVLHIFSDASLTDLFGWFKWFLLLFYEVLARTYWIQRSKHTRYRKTSMLRPPQSESLWLSPGQKHAPTTMLLVDIWHVLCPCFFAVSDLKNFMSLISFWHFLALPVQPAQYSHHSEYQAISSLHPKYRSCPQGNHITKSPVLYILFPFNGFDMNRSAVFAASR